MSKREHACRGTRPNLCEEVKVCWDGLIIALVTAILGFGGIAAASAGIAKLLFFIFLVLFVISLIFGWRGRRVP
jgi:uncharacterized membrane protein YtjA (UPF0391 family)